MRWFLMFSLLLAGTIQSQELKALSYNLRVDFGGDGENNWEFRRGLLVGQIGFYAPDFIGTQEGKHHQLEFIRTALPEYSYIGLSRDNSKTDGEFSAIFYKPGRFKLLSNATFWLSETPNEKSKGWDAALERICTYGLFEEIVTGKQFYVFNTHLDHMGELARTNSAKLIVEKIKAVNTKSLPVIFTGDFNGESNSAAYQAIVAFMDDSKIVSKTKPFGPTGTFNAFKFHEPVTLLIDYIFVSKGNIDVLKYAVFSDSKDCKYPSDHLPVYAEIKFRN